MSDEKILKFYRRRSQVEKILKMGWISTISLAWNWRQIMCGDWLEWLPVKDLGSIWIFLKNPFLKEWGP